MKSGQFMCLGTLKHLRNRFSTGFAVQIKISNDQDVNKVKTDLRTQLPGIEILGRIAKRIRVHLLSLSLVHR